MAEKTKIYIIGFEEISQFEDDIHCMKKLKSLKKRKIKLDAVFAKDFEKFSASKKYCSNYQIEAIKIDSDEEYFISIIRYSVNNPAKKNLATLISEKKTSNLNFWFKQDLDFEPHII